jgi:PAS domain S-box-containing protein
MRFSVKYKIASIIVVVVASMLLFTAFSFFRMLEQSRDEVASRNLDIAVDISKDLDELIIKSRAILKTLAKHPAVIAGDSRECDLLFGELLPNYPLHLNIVAAGMDGRNVGSGIRSSGLRSVNYSSLAWFQKARTGASVVGDLHTSLLLSVPAVMVAEPVFAGKQQTGVLGLPFDLPKVREYIAKGWRLPDHSTIDIIDSRGGNLLRIFFLSGTAVQHGEETACLVRENFLGATGVGEGAGPDGVERLYSYSRLPNAGWTVIVGVPSEKAFAQTYAMARHFVVLIFAGAALAAVLGVALSRRITRKTAALVRGMKAVEQGDMDYQVGLRGSDELSDIAKAFNRMARERKRAQEALAHSERKYRELVENAQIGVYQTTLDGDILYMNEAMMRLFGFDSLKEMISRKAPALYRNASDRELFKRRLKRDGRVASFETDMVKKDGTIRTVLLSASLDGEVISGMLRDITERKRAEDAEKRKGELLGLYHRTLVELAKNEELFKGEIKSAFETITEAAARAISVQRVSIWFYTDGLSGIRCAELFDGKQGRHSDGVLLSAVDFPAYFRALAEEDIIAAHDAHADPRTKEFSNPYLTPLCISSMLDIPIRKAGKTVGVVCHEHIGPSRTWTAEEQSFATAIAGFVTSVIEAYERVRHEQFVQNIFESMGEGLVAADREYRIIAANSAYCREAGRDRADVIGKHCYEVSHRIGRPCFEAGIDCPMRLTFDTGEPCSAVHNHAVDGGKSVFIEVTAYPVRDASGTVVSAIEIHNDVTEKRKLEDQLRQAQKMEAVGQLAGGVAHDFNNILTAIIGYAHLAFMKLREDDPSRHDIEQILASTQRATNLTQSLLAFGRKQPMKTELLDVNELVKQFEKFLRRLIREDVEFRTVCIQDDLAVMADRGQIEQVLMNLVTNARDAMPGGGRLTVETRAAMMDDSYTEAHGYGRPGDYALIMVSDTGTGMDRKTRAKIFEPFFTTKEQGKGTGLGLSVVYGIVKKHEGFINVYSEPGKGSIFKIYLPRQRSATAAGSDEHRETAAVAGGSETILVAEDDAVLRNLTTTVLGHFGYTVIEAEDGEDAVRKFVQNKDQVDMALLDGIMPRKNGREVYEEIRLVNPGIKVIFLSGYADGVLSDQEMRERGLTFMLKPVSPRQLVQKVREVLDR